MPTTSWHEDNFPLKNALFTWAKCWCRSRCNAWKCSDSRKPGATWELQAGRVHARRAAGGPGRGLSGIRAAISSPISMSSVARRTSGWFTGLDAFLLRCFRFVMLSLSSKRVNPTKCKGCWSFIIICSRLAIIWNEWRGERGFRLAVLQSVGANTDWR